MTNHSTERYPSVVVVGGGITGLAAAFILQESGRTLPTPLSITLLEAEDRLGGKVLTEEIDGLVIDAGPESFLARKVVAVDLARRLGLEDDLIGTLDANRRTFVWSRGRLRQLPEGLTLLVPGRLQPLLRSDLLSPVGKLRAAFDLILPPPADDGQDISVAAFMRQRFGRELTERLVEPLLAGIYGGDAEQLSLRATFPQLLDLVQQHGSLLRGVLAAGRSAKKAPPGRWTGFVSFRHGMGELTEALTQRLLAPGGSSGNSHQPVQIGAAGSPAIQIRLQTTVRTIRRQANQYVVECSNGTTLLADAVIVTLPAPAAGRVLGALDPMLSSTLAGIPYSSSVTISLAYRTTDLPGPLGGFGFVVPPVERRRILAATWVSSKWPARAPEGVALLRAFAGSSGGLDPTTVEDAELLRYVRTDLQEMMGLRATPISTRLYRWPHALPQYRLGHLDRVAAIEDRLQTHPGLFLAGAAYRGLGLPDCIASGESAAQSTLQFLGSDHLLATYSTEESISNP